MDLNEEKSLNCVPLPLRFKKLKRPSVSLLNEYEIDEDIDYDIFERSRNKMNAMVEMPSNMAELLSSLEDLIQIVQIASLKFEIARDALRIAVHLFYRVVLQEKNYDYHDFILYYEQYNKSLVVFSNEYYEGYEKWRYSINIKEKYQSRPRQENLLMLEKKEPRDDLPFLGYLIKPHNRVKMEERVVHRNHQLAQSVNEARELASCSSFLNSLPEYGNDRLGNNTTCNVETERFNDWNDVPEPTDCSTKSKCFCVGETDLLKECEHSPFVLYQLYRTGDFLMVTGDKDDDHRECLCYRMKCAVIRKIHPCYRDLAWGHKRLCLFRYWVFINCVIRVESFKMLQTIHPWIESLKEGILVPCSVNDRKRLSLKTFALKSLISNYVKIYKINKLKWLKI